MVRVKSNKLSKTEVYHLRVQYLVQQRIEKQRRKQMEIKPPRPTKAQMVYRKYVNHFADRRLSTYLVNYAWEHNEEPIPIPITSIFDDLRIEPSPDIKANLPLLML
jgi:methyltransferase-like protein